MESLERELTCSICSEILFQPLTLLDCLHTYCGHCLKEWYAAKALRYENNPHGPPPPGTVLFDCPSCRSPVRDTKHNATVASLLDMFLAANPDKVLPEEDKKRALELYKLGDRVIPEVRIRAVSAREAQEAEEDRSLIDQVRQISLQEVGARGDRPPISSVGRHHQRRRTNTGSDSDTDRERDRRRRAVSRTPRSRESSAAPRGSSDYLRSPTHRPPRSRHHSVVREGRLDTPPPTTVTTTITSVATTVSTDPRPRQVEHQSSLRSLLGTSGMTEEEIAQEIEELAKQIQREGLLDGLDLDNLDPDNHDLLSRRIAEAYQRRQKERERERRRRREVEEANHHSRSRSAHRSSDHRSERPHSRVRQGNTPNGIRRASEDRPRTLTQDMPASNFLDVNNDYRHRRAASTGNPPSERSATDPLTRPVSSDGRSGRIHMAGVTGKYTMSSPRDRTHGEGEGGSFASRLPQVVVAQPSSEAISNSTTHSTSPASSLLVTSKVSEHSRTVSAPVQPTQTLNITCSNCKREHIEEKLHYNCAICDDGNWCLCLLCYRRGAGCKHWFGFGYSAWRKWEKEKSKNPRLDSPHMLRVGRYRKKLPGESDEPEDAALEQAVGNGYKFEAGCFCSRCHAQTNACYWRCDICNDGDWGFCSACVNQGKRCGHPLLPLTYQPSLLPIVNLETSENLLDIKLPPHSSLLTTARPVGAFRPLSFEPPCHSCNLPIPPGSPRYHCYQCNNGEYDLCTPCYTSMVPVTISPTNGPSGWRRCPSGHRMIIESYTSAPSGQHRFTNSLLSGGLLMKMVDDPSRSHLLWTSRELGVDISRYVSRSVDVDVSADEQLPNGSGIPKERDLGETVTARWGWFGVGEGAEDEVYFPRGAGLREVERVDGEWWFGVYMDERGLFPAGYVRTDG